jgi:hypothetical protein
MESDIKSGATEIGSSKIELGLTESFFLDSLSQEINTNKKQIIKHFIL